MCKSVYFGVLKNKDHKSLLIKIKCDLMTFLYIPDVLQ